MNSTRIQEAAKKAADRLLSLPKGQLASLVKEHLGGDFAKLMLNSGVFDSYTEDTSTIDYFIYINHPTFHWFSADYSCATDKPILPISPTRIFYGDCTQCPKAA